MRTQLGVCLRDGVKTDAELFCLGRNCPQTTCVYSFILLTGGKRVSNCSLSSVISHMSKCFSGHIAYIATLVVACYSRSLSHASLMVVFPTSGVPYSQHVHFHHPAYMAFAMHELSRDQVQHSISCLPLGDPPTSPTCNQLLHPIRIT